MIDFDIPADTAALRDEIRAFVTEQTARWGKIVQQAGLAGSE